jgi:NAD(P)-dependent dehydrogenase (short-subunit alcohol dehydrogenase family)
MSFSGKPKPLVEQTEEEFNQFYKSGLLSSFHMMCLCYPYLKVKGGKVICIGSGAGITGELGMCALGAIKESIRALARTAAREWGKDNINVNILNPGAVTDAIWDAMADWPEEDKDPLKMGFNPTVLGRLGDPYEDIAPVAVFLASEDSRHITGQTIMAEGGVTITA